MAEKVYKFNLDIKTKTINIPRMNFVSGDTDSNVLDITLIDNYQKLDITGDTVRFVFKKADDTTVFQDGIVVDAVSGNVKVTLSSQSITYPGNVDVEVLLYNGDTRLTSTQFSFTVTKGLLSESTVESSNEYESLTEALNAAGDINTRFNTVNTQLADIATLNVKSYGAVGDGLTDDTQAFRNAITALKNMINVLKKPMGSILVPSTGIWVITDTIESDLNGIIFKSENSEVYSKIICKTQGKTMFNIKGNGVKFLNVTFVGDMDINDPVTTPATVTAINFDRVTSADIDADVIGCTFFALESCIKTKGRNVNIYKNMFSSCKKGVTINNIANEQTRGIIIDNNRFHNMGLGSNSAPALADSVCVEFIGDKTLTIANRVVNNHCDYGKRFLTTNSLNGMDIDNNYIYSYTSGIICISDTFVTSNISFSICRNKIINSVVDYGIRVEQILNGKVDGNIVDRATVCGIYLYKSLQNSDIQHNTVVNSKIGIKIEYPSGGSPLSWFVKNNNIKDDLGVCDYGIYALNCPNGQINGNNIRQTLKEAIYTENCANTSVCLNNILNASTEQNAGVYTYAYSAILIKSCANAIATYNIIRSQQATATHKYGIDVQSSTNTNVKDNMIVNYYLASINYDSTSINSLVLLEVPKSVATPTASAQYRGKFIRFEGGAGQADSLFMCMKKADDTYAWIRII